jgi:hypothetical protein
MYRELARSLNFLSCMSVIALHQAKPPTQAAPMATTNLVRQSPKEHKMSPFNIWSIQRGPGTLYRSGLVERGINYEMALECYRKADEQVSQSFCVSLFACRCQSSGPF